MYYFVHTSAKTQKNWIVYSVQKSKMYITHCQQIRFDKENGRVYGSAFISVLFGNLGKRIRCENSLSKYTEDSTLY